MSFTTTRRVEFGDTDAAGIAHFSAFFAMMESAEHEMLRSLGISVMPKESGDPGVPPVSWPRVSATCNFASAARFEDVLTIQVRLERIGNTSVEYHFRFSLGDCLVADGRMSAVCCRLIHPPAAGGTEPEPRLEKTPIPDEIRELLVRHQ